MVVCAQRGQYSTHHKSVHSELAIETLNQLGKVDQIVWDGAFLFMGVRMGAQGTLKAA